MHDDLYQDLYYFAVKLELHKIMELLFSKKSTEEILSIKDLDDHYLRQLHLAIYDF